MWVKATVLAQMMAHFHHRGNSVGPNTFLYSLSLHHRCGIWVNNFFKNLGIPGPRPLSFTGTFLEH